MTALQSQGSLHLCEVDCYGYILLGCKRRIFLCDDNKPLVELFNRRIRRSRCAFWVFCMVSSFSEAKLITKGTKVWDLKTFKLSQPKHPSLLGIIVLCI